jgi:RNA polymerase sigma-70 factor, ECF subfamily
MITETSTTLLAGLQDLRNEAAWCRFCERYTPVLLSFARRLGLDEHEAQDAAQDTLLSFSEAHREGRYDPARGRLRNWLFSIASHRIRDIQRGRRRVLDEQAMASGFLVELPDDDTQSHLWEDEWRKAVLRACIEEARNSFEPATLRAFQLFALEGWPAAKVAAHLRTSENAVFLAKSRVLACLRERLKEMEENW